MFGRESKQIVDDAPNAIGYLEMLQKQDSFTIGVHSNNVENRKDTVGLQLKTQVTNLGENLISQRNDIDESIVDINRF